MFQKYLFFVQAQCATQKKKLRTETVNNRTSLAMLFQTASCCVIPRQASSGQVMLRYAALCHVA